MQDPPHLCLWHWCLPHLELVTADGFEVLWKLMHKGREPRWNGKQKREWTECRCEIKPLLWPQPHQSTKEMPRLERPPLAVTCICQKLFRIWGEDGQSSSWGP